MSLVNQIQIIGHVCHDKTPDGFILGGTASYASIIAAHLCNEVRLLTSFGSDFLFQEELENIGVRIKRIESSKTTVFENIYKGENRIQYLHSKASNILLNEFRNLGNADLTLIGPIADEVHQTESFLNQRTGFKGALIQGWLREFDALGKVIKKMPNPEIFKGLDAIIMSDDDIRGYPDFLIQATEVVPLAVVTKGENGATVYNRKEVHHFPSFRTMPVEFTGAGDIFGTAFLCSYAIDQNLIFASSFAHSAASLSIEGIGINAIPSIMSIENRRQIYLKDYL